MLKHGFILCDERVFAGNSTPIITASSSFRNPPPLRLRKRASSVCCGSLRTHSCSPTYPCEVRKEAPAKKGQRGMDDDDTTEGEMHPTMVRRTIVNDVMRAVKATVGGTYGMAVTSEGKPRVHRAIGLGAEPGASFIPQMESRDFEYFIGDAASYVDMAATIGRFDIYQAKDVPSYFFERVWRPMEVHSCIAINIAEGHQFIAHVCVFRGRNYPPFTKDDLYLLRELQKKTNAALCTAYAREHISNPGALSHRTPQLHEGTLFFGLDNYGWLENGDVAAFRNFGARQELLKRAHRMVEQHARHSEFFLNDALVRLARLSNEHTTGAKDGFLAKVSKVQPWRMSSIYFLPRATRRVAAMAANSSTVDEIAASLKRSPETIRTHLKSAYSFLDISSRVELAVEVLGALRSR